VKSWRICLLLLLAVLLPVRGAVAAAMLCPVAGSGAQLELAMVGQSAGHAAMDAAMSHDHTGGHDHASGHGHAADTSADGQAGHDRAASEACNACSAYCSLTPLVSSLPTLAEPLDPTAVKFSDFSAPPPSFVSGGQERPPRTI
jgi:hypothetical protein